MKYPFMGLVHEALAEYWESFCCSAPSEAEAQSAWAQIDPHDLIDMDRVCVADSHEELMLLDTGLVSMRCFGVGYHHARPQNYDLPEASVNSHWLLDGRPQLSYAWARFWRDLTTLDERPGTRAPVLEHRP